MKIDCPHCGVHGSVDDTLAGKRLRCPACSKVFLVAEEVLPDMDDSTLVRQEIFHTPAAGEQLPASEEDDSESLGEVETAAEDLEEALGIADELEETEVDEEAVVGDEVSVTEDDELAFDDDDDDDDLLDFTDDDDDDGDEYASAETALDTCDECGESLHPEFLETVNGKKYCALCLPEDYEADLELTEFDEQEAFEEDAEEEIEAEESPDTEDSSDSAQALMVDDDVDESDDEVGYPKEACSVCGDTFHRDFMQEIDSQLYCGVCQPEVIETVPVVSSHDEQSSDEGEGDEGLFGDEGQVDGTDDEFETDDTDFTVGEIVKEAWQKTKGAKGSIWGGATVMYAVLFAISLGGSFAVMQIYGESDPTMAMGVNSGLQMITAWFSMLFTGGLMLIGVRRALEQRVSWKQVFAGFSGAKIVSMTVAVFLQFLLVMIGFILLVLPGIYLSVGYALTLPLILDKGLGPWEALEASRKAIHKKWWTVFGLYVVMMLLYTVSVIPLGLGLIWTVPMFFVLIGVLYSRFFVSPADLEEAEEVMDEEEETEELDEESEESV